MSVSPSIIQALKKLNPALPPAEDEYLSRDWEGMPRSWDLPERIQVLLGAGYRVKALLHGAIGVGKSTELSRWAKALGSDAFVVTGTVTAPSKRITQLGLDLLGQTRRRLEREGSAQAQSLSEQILKTDVSKEMNGLGPNFRTCMEAIESYAGRPILFLIDGTDLFDADEAALAFGPAGPFGMREIPSAVFVAPHAFLTLGSREERAASFEHVWNLPAFGVQNRDGSENHAAMGRLAEGLARRLDGVDAFVDPLDDTLRRVAWLSGGVPRDAIRILHAAVLSAAKAGRVNRIHLVRGIQEVQQDLAQSLRDEDWRLLGRVAETGNHQGARELIGHNAILAYEGERERYWRPHPLLLDLLSSRGG